MPDYKYAVMIGTWNNSTSKNKYLTNFYTQRISASADTFPAPVASVNEAESLFSAIGNHKIFNVVVPGTAPNALHVVKVLTGVEQGKPKYAMIIRLIPKGDISEYVGDTNVKAVTYLHDVEFMGFAKTNSTVVSGSGYSDDDSMAATFRGIAGPITSIDI